MNDFEELFNDIDNFEKDMDKATTEIIEEVSTECVAETQGRTPVKTGNLRRSWTRSSVYKINGSKSVEIGSSLEYAKAVEEGHKQEVGRYVPAIGKKLVNEYVEGKHMLRDSFTLAEQSLDNKLNDLFERLDVE